MAQGKEKQLVNAILTEYRKRGAFAEKIHGGPSQPRLVDIIACYHGYFIALECKTGTGKLTPSQAHVLRDVDRAGGIAETAWTLEDAMGILTSIDRSIVERAYYA